MSRDGGGVSALDHVSGPTDPIELFRLSVERMEAAEFAVAVFGREETAALRRGAPRRDAFAGRDVRRPERVGCAVVQPEQQLGGAGSRGQRGHGVSGVTGSAGSGGQRGYRG